MRVEWVRGYGNGRSQGIPAPTPAGSTRPDARQSEFQGQPNRALAEVNPDRIEAALDAAEAKLILDAGSVTETAAATLLDESRTPDQQATAQRMADAADAVVTTEMGVPMVIHKQELSAVAPEGVPSANPTGNTTVAPPGPPVNPLGTQSLLTPDLESRQSNVLHPLWGEFGRC